MDERWLVTGACGQLGAYVMEHIRRTAPRAEVLGIGRRQCDVHGTVEAVDVAVPTEVSNLLERFRPTHVVHLAGVTSPERAAEAPGTAWKVNVGVTQQITSWAVAHGSWMFYPSTDFVWPGDHGRAWREDDSPRPLSFYASSKLCAEREVLRRGGCVVRFSLLYGDPRCERHTTWTRLRAAFEAGREVRACTDEYRTPLPLASAAEIVVELGRRRHSGLLHAAGPDVVTPYELFSRLADSIGTAAALVPISRTELPAGRERPANMAMDAGRLREVLPHVTLPSVGEVLGGGAPGTVPVSVAIPAYHGADHLVRSMSAIARQDYAGPMHVVVAVNDGRKDTWDAAEKLAGSVRARNRRCEVIRTPPGRAAAFNGAERSFEPGSVRVYLDQDADLSPGAVRGIVQLAGDRTSERFVALPLRLVGVRSRMSRLYYRGWSRLPYVRSSPVTIGAYSVSVGGRERWGPFPDLHSDDKYVRLRFQQSERVVVPGEWYSVHVPEGVRELVRARTRYRHGNRELRTTGLHDTVPRYRGIAGLVVRRPSTLVELATVALVHLLALLSRPDRRGGR